MRGRLVLAAAAALLVAVVIGGALFWDAIPGTLYRDRHGDAHGAGRRVYRYKSGPVMLVEDYDRGQQRRSEWFRPDGTSILVTEWADGSGVGLLLREDGSVWARRAYVRGVAQGPTTYFARDGSVLGEAVFEGG